MRISKCPRSELHCVTNVLCLKSSSVHGVNPCQLSWAIYMTLGSFLTRLWKTVILLRNILNMKSWRLVNASYVSINHHVAKTKRNAKNWQKLDAQCKVYKETLVHWTSSVNTAAAVVIFETAIWILKHSKSLDDISALMLSNDCFTSVFEFRHQYQWCYPPEATGAPLTGACPSCLQVPKVHLSNASVTNKHSHPVTISPRGMKKQQRSPWAGRQCSPLQEPPSQHPQSPLISVSMKLMWGFLSGLLEQTEEMWTCFTVLKVFLWFTSWK